MSAPLRTYGRAREPSVEKDTGTAPVVSNSPLLSPNSRVKKLLADLGDSSDDEEDVDQLRSKFLSKKTEAEQAEAEKSPLVHRSSGKLFGKLPSKSIFDTKEADKDDLKSNDDDTNESQKDTQDDADGLAFSKEIVPKPKQKLASPDVDSMADTQPDFEDDTQPDFEETQPDEDAINGQDDDAEKDKEEVTQKSASDVSQPTKIASPSLDPLSSPFSSPIAKNTPTVPQSKFLKDGRPRRKRVIADSDSEDELPSSTLSSSPKNTGLTKTTTDGFTDISDFSDSEAEQSEDESQQRVAALKERLASTVDELDPFEDADASVISSQKPTRKASKKALEEIERETQRISRQRNLAPEVYTTGLVTKQNLLARFGMAPKVEEEKEEVAAPTTPGKAVAPHSDDSIMDFDLNSSPLTSDLHPQEVKDVSEVHVTPCTPSKKSTPSKMSTPGGKMMPPATPSLSRSVNKKQVKKLANVGVPRMASYIQKRPSQLLSTLSDSDDDLLILPDAEADKVPESFRKMQQQGVPVAFSSQKPAAGPDFFSQMRSNIRKQHAQIKAESEKERVQLGLVDMTEQDKEDEAVESLLDQARRQQQEIADREKREKRKARDDEYDSVAESDHDWFDDDEAGAELGEVPDSEDDMDVDLSDEDGLQAQQALVDGVSDGEEDKDKQVEEEEADTQPDFPEDAPVDSVDDILAGIVQKEPEPKADISSTLSSPMSSPSRDNTAYLRQLAEDEAAHRRREKARSSTSGLLDGEAEESDDDWAGLGGASDEETTRPEDLAEIGAMVDDTKGIDRENYAANRQYDLQKDLDDDAKQVEKLLEDVTNGGLRRKRANNLNLDFSDSEDEDELRRKRRILSERKKKRMLEAGNLEDLAKNPEAAAFIRAMQDSDSDEEEEDVFALPTKPTTPGLKRDGPALPKKKPSVQETLSFLCEESAVEVPPSSPGGISDMESDDDLIITGQTHSTIDLTASRQDTVPDNEDEDDYLERLGPSRNVVVRETEEDEELKTIIGPNGNFHGLIRKKKQSMTSMTSSTESMSSSKKKNAKYLQQQEAETQKQQSLKNRFLAKFKSVGTKPKSQSYMKGGSFY